MLVDCSAEFDASSTLLARMNACYRAAACEPFLRASRHKITPNSMLVATALIALDFLA